MADPVTSKISTTYTGRDGLKKRAPIFTATKVTPTTDASGNKTYVMEIIQYDNEKGEGGKVIGVRDGNNITFNENASDDIRGNKTAIKNINKNSKTQAKTIKNEVATTAADKKAFNKSNAKGNEGTEYENEQNRQKITNAATKAGESVTGTREKDGSFGGPYVFPTSLRQGGENGQDFLKFDMLSYKPKKFDNQSFSFADRNTEREALGTVILPIPGGIQDGQNVQWGGQSMTPLDMAKANIALTTVLDGPGKAVAKTGDMARNIAGAMGDNSDALAAVIAGMAAGGQQLLTRTTGAIANPNMELLFGGPQLRNFSFQFLLAPRNKKEAMTVIQIIRFFKQGMSPIRTKARLFMKSPHTFRLSYRNSNGDQHKYLNKFKECALGTFTVNYAPNGNYSTFEDGVMTAYQMSMTYRELNPIYNDDYGADGNEMPKEIGF